MAIGLADRLQVVQHILCCTTHSALVVALNIKRNLTPGIQQQGTLLGCEGNKTLLGIHIIYIYKPKGSKEQKKDTSCSHNLMFSGTNIQHFS